MFVAFSVRRCRILSATLSCSQCDAVAFSVRQTEVSPLTQNWRCVLLYHCLAFKIEIFWKKRREALLINNNPPTGNHPYARHCRIPPMPTPLYGVSWQPSLVAQNCLLWFVCRWCEKLWLFCPVRSNFDYKGSKKYILRADIQDKKSSSGRFLLFLR